MGKQLRKWMGTVRRTAMVKRMVMKRSMESRPVTATVSRPLPEVWGGIECTVNRVGDLYFDQLERNGHAQRIEDLELFATLGLRTLRYPMLWERIAPDGI